MAGTLMSLTLMPVRYSHDARAYAMVILGAIVTSHLFFLLLRRPSSRVASVYIITSALSIYSHLYAGAVVGGQLILALAAMLKPETRTAGKKLALLAVAALLLALLLYLPFLSDLITYTQSVGRKVTGRELSWPFLVNLALRWAGGQTHPYRSLLPLFLAGTGWAVMARKRPLLAGLPLLMLTVGLLVPLALRTFVYQRFYVFVLPWFYLALAASGESLWQKFRAGPVISVGLLALAALFMNSELPRYWQHGKQGLRPAAQWIEAHALESRVLVLGMVGEVFEYYCPRAIAVEGGAELRPADLARTVVVFSYPATVGGPNLRLLSQHCPPPITFPAFSGHDADVVVYNCP
jgi:hypothetical protein